jgi:ornithine cyclodeaminase/alanine dehydrogenase-like protein (mu-crystallin family)
VLDAGAVTALRTGAAAVLAAETLGRAAAETAAVIGAGVNGEAAARTFIALGRRVQLWDLDRTRAELVAEVDEAVSTAQQEDTPIGSEEDWCAVSTRELVDQIP